MEAHAAGRSVVIDNTNLAPAHRTIYKQIADAFGATTVVEPMCPAMWLDCAAATRKETVDAVTARAVVRSMLPGEFEIGRTVIERALARALDSLKTSGLTVSEWLESFPPPPLTKRGVSLFHGAVVFRSAAVDEACAAALGEARVEAHPGATAARLLHSIHSGPGEFHVTVLSPKEQVVVKKQVGATYLELMAAALTADPTSLVARGVGKVVQAAGGAWVMFVVYDWEAGQAYRASVGLERKDFHATVAYSHVDIHEVAKDASSSQW
jgi:hypothetical protein